MKSRGMLAAALMLGVIAGCHHKKPVVVEPASPQTIQAIRQSYTSVDPNARVGVVIAILPQKGLVAVGDVAVADFKEGDVLVLMDSHRHIIAAGKVVAKTADALHVTYDISGADEREPQVGDVAVKVVH
jgi:hypothetical protein